MKRIDGQPRIAAASVVGSLFNHPIVRIVDLVIAELAQGECSLVAVERDVAGGIGMLVATQTLPSDLLAAGKLKIGNVCVGRLLIVLIAVAAAGGNHDGGKLHSQPPAAKVQGMHSVVA